MSGSGFSIPPYMQQNSVGSNYSLNGELPPEIALKEQALNRRQQIANLMTQNSMRPLQGGMAGRFYVPPSVFQGLAQLGEAAGGAYINNQVDKGRTDLADENKRVMSDAVQQYIKRTAGTPEQPGQPMEVQAQGPPRPELVNALASQNGPGDPGTSGKLPDMSAPVKIAGAFPTATVTGPSTPAQPATAQDRFLAGMEMRNTLGPAANPFLQMAQHTQDMQEQRDFQAKEHQLTRDTTTAQAQQQRDFLTQEKALDRENRLAAAKLDIDGKLATGLITQKQHDEQMAQTQKLHDERMSTDKERDRQNAMAMKRLEVGSKEKIAETKASTPKAMSPTTQKELFETEDTIASSQGVMKSLDQALAINSKAYEGVGAGPRATIASNLPFVGKEGANATVELNNIVTNQALSQLKLAVGGNPTEGERKIMMEVQGSVSLPAPQREAIYKRAKEAAERRLKWAQNKAKQLRDGSYFGEQSAFTDEPAAAPAATSGWSITPIP